MAVLYPNLCNNEVCYKGTLTALYIILFMGGDLKVSKILSLF